MPIILSLCVHNGISYMLLFAIMWQIRGGRERERSLKQLKTNITKQYETRDAQNFQLKVALNN